MPASCTTRPRRLTALERIAPEAVGLVGNLFLAVWLALEAHHLARMLTEPGSPLHPGPPPVGIQWLARREALSVTLAAVAWLVQAMLLTWHGPRGPLVLRLGGGVLGLSALVRLCVRDDSAWWLDQGPVLYPASLFHLLAAAFMVLIALRLASLRERLPAGEKRTPELWATGASLLLMAWSMREAAHVATAMIRPDTLSLAQVEFGTIRREQALGAAMASAAWLAQAVALLLVGWRRESAFVRWSGLALIGLTLLKFVVFDLRTVDVFWRFVTAIAVGAAMLMFSYAYQRRTRANRLNAGPPPGE